MYAESQLRNDRHLQLSVFKQLYEINSTQTDAFLNKQSLIIMKPSTVGSHKCHTAFRFGEIKVSCLWILDPADVGEQNRCARSVCVKNSDWRRAYPDWLSSQMGVAAGEVLHLSSPLLLVQGSEHILKTKI